MKSSRTAVDQQNRTIFWIAIASLLVLGAIWGILWYRRPPALEHDYLRYVQLLRTAVSAQNEQHLLGVERVLARDRDAQKLPHSHWKHFQGIIDLAKGGNWEDADLRCQAFEAAQQNR